MDPNLRSAIHLQFGAALDMLENAVRACPEEHWTGPRVEQAFWYLTFHTLFWLDYYLADDPATFAPPPPYTLGEMDPAGVYPDRPYRKDELLAYLDHGRRRLRETIEGLDEARARETRTLRWGELTRVELLLYNMRHVQHHAGQLNLMLRQSVDAAPRWVGRSRT